MADEEETPTPRDLARVVGATVQRSAEAHALADVAGLLATAADRLRDASQRYDGTGGRDKAALRSRLAGVLEEAGDACVHASTAFADTERIEVNWKSLPWMKLVLLALAGGAGAVAANLDPAITVFGVSLQHMCYLAAGGFAGWAKRAPGDTKATP